MTKVIGAEHKDNLKFNLMPPLSIATYSPTAAVEPCRHLLKVASFRAVNFEINTTTVPVILIALQESTHFYPCSTNRE